MLVIGILVCSRGDHFQHMSRYQSDLLSRIGQDVDRVGRHVAAIRERPHQTARERSTIKSPRVAFFSLT